LRIFEKLLLGEVRMELHLIHHRFDSAIAEEIHKALNLREESRSLRGKRRDGWMYHEISNTDVANESFIDKTFHAGPSLRVRHRIQLDLRIFTRGVMDPLRRVSGLKGNEFLGDWEMNQIEIEIFQSHVAERLLASRFNMLLGMIGVPEFGCHLNEGVRGGGGLEFGRPKDLVF
jgi:hypothetical protein